MSGDLRTAFVSNYMIDLPWMLSAMPSLLRAAQRNGLIIAHGESAEWQASATVAALTFIPVLQPCPEIVDACDRGLSIRGVSGCSTIDMRQILDQIGAANVTVHKPYLPEKFGVHHSKARQTSNWLRRPHAF